MNQKGFTLIELLATITILSMIMLVAIPNIMSTLDKSKRRTYVEDAKKMITLINLDQILLLKLQMELKPMFFH